MDTNQRIADIKAELARLAPALAAQHDELRADAVDETLIEYAAELDAELNYLTAREADEAEAEAYYAEAHGDEAYRFLRVTSWD